MLPGTGGRGSYGHRHPGQEEVYFVISGVVTFKIDDDVFEAGPQTAVRVGGGAFRSVHNDTDDEAELLIVSPRLDQPPTEKQDDFWPPRSAHVAALIDRYDAAWNAQDLDAIASMHDDAIVFTTTRPASVSRARRRCARTSARSSRAGRRFVSSAASCAAARTSRRASGPRVPCTPTTVASSNRTGWTSPPHAEGRIARKDVYRAPATPRVVEPASRG